MCNSQQLAAQPVKLHQDLSDVVHHILLLLRLVEIGTFIDQLVFFREIQQTPPKISRHKFDIAELMAYWILLVIDTLGSSLELCKAPDSLALPHLG
jgi:hypothetical protein